MIWTIISLKHMQPASLTKPETGFLLVTIKKNNTFLSFSLHLIYPNPTLKFNKKKSQTEIWMKTRWVRKEAEGWFVEAALYL